MTSKPPVDYTAQASSPIVNGEVKLKIEKNSFIAAELLDIAEVPYVSITSIEFKDYVVTVRTDDGNYVFSRMGQWAQPFYDNLCDAYRKALLRGHFIAGYESTVALGEYRFTEDGRTVSGGKVPIHVYWDCVMVLPSNPANVRRIPLCFVTGMEKGEHELTLKVSNSSGGTDSYTFLKLGNYMAQLANWLEIQIRKTRDSTLEVLKEFDTTLSISQYSQLAKLLPKGVAAPMGQVRKIAPSFADAIESRISRTRGGDSYAAFKEMVGADNIWVGFRKENARETGTDVEGEEGAENEEGDNGDNEAVKEKMAFLFWMLVPSPCGRFATIEFAEANTATFVYRTNGNFARTAMELNRALAGIRFTRNAIRLTDEDLAKPSNVDYLMAAKRSAAMQFIRNNFEARLIHNDSWKKRLIEVWSQK